MKIILITCKNVIAIFILKNHGANCAWRENYSSNQFMYDINEILINFK